MQKTENEIQAEDRERDTKKNTDMRYKKNTENGIQVDYREWVICRTQKEIEAEHRE